ncbi:MAG: iron-sulfur cluster assembly accessory protein [Mariprofundaceae bacterium]|nr:iron-sulfur cluster assembly accessory protein [Mariprofundaceae bacterium]
MIKDCNITLSDAAVAQFHKALRKAGKQAVRLSLQKAGCSGLEYVVDFSDAPNEGDLTLQQDGVLLYVDAASYAQALTGLHIDYQQDVLSSSFVYQNPNKKGECGCGVSFTV